MKILKILKILSPLSPILSQNWKHDLARSCFILKVLRLQLFNCLKYLPQITFFQHHAEHYPEEQAQPPSPWLRHLPPIVLHNISDWSPEIQVYNIFLKEVSSSTNFSFFSITSNLLGNQGLDYELLSGVKTARIGNMLNAEQVKTIATFRDFMQLIVNQNIPLELLGYQQHQPDQR